jgi:hypothetical protein
MTLIDLKDKHKGKTCNIIGCGTSVKKLTSKYFDKNDIIIALYHTIILVESWGLEIPVYSLQKDGGYFEGCNKQCERCFEKMVSPKNAMLLSTFNCLPHYENRLIFDILELKDCNTHSGETAILLSELMGCTHINMIGFDSHFGKYDTLLIDNELNYIEKTYEIQKHYYSDSNNDMIKILKDKSHNWFYLGG